MSSSTSTQPLLLLGDKRRRALAARVSEALRRWRGSWVRDSAGTFEVTTEAPSPTGYAAPIASVMTSCWALELGTQRLAVLLLPHVTFAWAVQETGTTAIDTAGGGGSGLLAERLEQDVARSLLSELCLLDAGDATVVERLPADALLDWSRDARAWTFHARASGGGRGISVLLAASRVESLAPARAPVSGSTLAARRVAVGENTVALRAVVGETTMPVAELTQLALDDVLLLDRRLSEPVSLVAPDTGAAVATGNLGRTGSRRAIKLAGIQAQRN